MKAVRSGRIVVHILETEKRKVKKHIQKKWNSLKQFLSSFEWKKSENYRVEKKVETFFNSQLSDEWIVNT